MTGWDVARRQAKVAERDDDLAVLRALIDDVDVREGERAMFVDMLDRLEDGQTVLTEKQRATAREAAERVGIRGNYENLISSGKAPRGREVPTPAVLLNLPKKPPGRL